MKIHEYQGKELLRRYESKCRAAESRVRSRRSRRRLENWDSRSSSKPKSTPAGAAKAAASTSQDARRGA